MKLLPIENVKKILTLISKLRKNKFLTLLNKSAERGSYLLFENYLIDTLGMKISGSLHIGRSRNDINATAFKLSIREFYAEIYNNVIKLRHTMLQQANKYMDLVMPIYSQFQVGQVGTYAYYLLAFEESLARDQFFLKELFFLLDECPIGAASVFFKRIVFFTR
jgi:argininosuccinate lyase